MPKREGSGRKTDYKAEFCEKAHAVLSAEPGVGIAELAAALDVTERTIYIWRKLYPDFKDAIERGLAKSKAQLLQDARRSTHSSKDFCYNTPLFTRLLTSVYRDSENAAVMIDGWREAKSIFEKFGLVLDAMGEGDITPDQAAKISEVLTKHAQAIELQSLKEKVEALEQRK